MAKPRVFTSFDYDHDEDLKRMLLGQAQHSDARFELTDWSLKEYMTGGRKEK